MTDTDTSANRSTTGRQTPSEGVSRNGRLRTGIFSGSFNPIHIGHLALANYLCEFAGLDEVWFLVSPHNPLKKQDDLWDDHFRLRLVELATADYPRFQASDFEFNLPRPSYSVHTLAKLQETYPDRDFYLIIGSDNWQLFDKWYHHEEIIARHQILVYPRPGYPIDETDLPPSVHLTPAPTFEISSTFVRKALQQGKDIRYFVHPAVYRAIKESQSQAQ